MFFDKVLSPGEPLNRLDIEAVELSIRNLTLEDPSHCIIDPLEINFGFDVIGSGPNSEESKESEVNESSKSMNLIEFQTKKLVEARRTIIPEHTFFSEILLDKIPMILSCIDQINQHSQTIKAADRSL